TGVGVKSLHTDISTKTGERIIVFTLERVLVKRVVNKP
ncbi:MAG: Na-translocating system protein MpsC family protein, partial [bacterium]